MPELPDLIIYREAVETRIQGERLERVEVTSPFLLRTVQPPLASFPGRTAESVRLQGKRICIEFDGGLWLAVHLMIAGRLHWNKRGGQALLRLVFPTGTLSLTEAGRERRASLHAFSSKEDLRRLDQGGADPFTLSAAGFQYLLRRENHTLKRALTDPSILSGIGNSYSDEILHRARLSPLALTGKLSAAEYERLHGAVQSVLAEWTEKLRGQADGAFPEKVTAFREGMAVHGRFRQPCPDCGAQVQRIRYAANETNYCPQCQTGGRLLADRALSRLLGQDWRRTMGES
jgi:formamidopyrimidine-DNA glycosylase